MTRFKGKFYRRMNWQDRVLVGTPKGDNDNEILEHFKFSDNHHKPANNFLL